MKIQQFKKQLACFFRGHTMEIKIHSRKIIHPVTHHIMGFASLLKCRHCGKERSVVTWREE